MSSINPPPPGSLLPPANPPTPSNGGAGPGITGTWTYSGNPANSPADAVRFEVGDTNERQPQLSDAEVAYLLQRSGGSVAGAALEAISNIMAKYKSAVDETTGPVSRAFSQRLKNLASIRQDLEYRLCLQGGDAGFVGGISNINNYTNRQDQDWDRPSFSTRMMENPHLDARGAPYVPFENDED